MSSFWYRNSLGLVLFGCFLVLIAGQFFAGWFDYNHERREDGEAPWTIGRYAVSGHNIEAIAENWESEFLQMAAYVMFTIWLRQWGSAESKPVDKQIAVDSDPQPTANAPWPVRKGGLWLTLYSNSLSLAFLILFAFSFAVHLYGSTETANEELIEKGLPTVTWTEQVVSSRFWFESLQNWQSEFLAMLSIVLLSIWLRQQGSPESKPVDAPHSETEE